MVERGKGASAAAVARVVGVSPAAVSYALRGLPGVSEATRARIIQVADELGYQPAAEVPTSAHPALGLILADTHNPFYSELAISVADAARAAGYETFISHTRDDKDSVEAAIESMLHHQIDGMLLTAVQSSNANIARLLRAAKVPYVQISRRMTNAEADFVGIDDTAAATTIIEHLLSHGFRRVAIVTGPTTSTASAARATAVRAALRRAGLELPGDWNITTGLTQADGARAAEHLLSLTSLPEAVVCGNDATAIGLMGVLMSRGLVVPTDIAVSGFDGLTTAPFGLLDLTTVVQPRHRMAAEAVKLLTQRREAPNAQPATVLCQHSLHIGTTCGCTTTIGEHAS